METVSKHIEQSFNIADGKPRIAGRRITVQNIAVWHERLGKTADEIASEFDLSLAEVYAALAYYFDHRDEIDELILKEQQFVSELKKEIPSKLTSKLKENM